jgi:hypothetical protein
MILAEELLLLGLRDEKGTVSSGAHMPIKYGIIGAMLADLLLMDRLTLNQKSNVMVAKNTPTGDEFLDEVLAIIAKREKSRTMKDWVLVLGNGDLKNASDRLARRLVTRGILREEEGHFLWIFSTHQFPTVDPRPEQQLRSMVYNTIISGAIPDDRTRILLSLIKASKLVNEVFPEDQRKTANKRIEELAKDDATGTAVTKAIEAVQAAVIAAVTAATAASAASSASH